MIFRHKAVFVFVVDKPIAADTQSKTTTSEVVSWFLAILCRDGVCYERFGSVWF